MESGGVCYDKWLARDRKILQEIFMLVVPPRLAPPIIVFGASITLPFLKLFPLKIITSSLQSPEHRKIGEAILGHNSLSYDMTTNKVTPFSLEHLNAEYKYVVAFSVTVLLNLFHLCDSL